MKSNKYADLVKFGLNPQTLMTLSESNINQLHKSLIEKKEIKEQSSPNKREAFSGEKIIVGTNNSFAVPPGKKAEVVNTGGKTEVIVSGKEEDDKDESKNNPWSICHAQLGPKKTPKFERCVREVKKSLKEGKNYFDILLERKIVYLLEKHMSPKMTKGDLLNLLEAKKMKTPIGKITSLGLKTENKDSDTKTKPTTKPGTKTPPKEKPHDPFKPKREKNPEERPKVRPKAETKEAVMDAPAKPKTDPTTKPGTKTPPKKKPFDPLKPDEHKQPKPKARKKLPSWLTFNSLGIKFKK